MQTEKLHYAVVWMQATVGTYCA